MGNIKFYGIVEDYEKIASNELAQCEIPDNAHIINEFTQMNMKNYIIFTLPIIIVIMTIIIMKQVKNGFLNKEIRKEVQEENIKKYKLDTNKKKIKFAIKNFLKVYISLLIFMCCITVIHEYLHAIPGAIMGYNVKIAIGFPMGGATWSLEDTTKMQTLIFSLTPCVVLGVIPAIIAITMKVTKKNYLVNWIMAFICCIMIFSCGYDIINSYNTLKNVPNNAYVGQKEDIYYWYHK